ncbi:hypothetical protein [Deinococcus maricopensis]|uniref:Uncharacterized protein n=1 Tax=Deinococcus maricopensis (strain DSM 21211 / LMG 22137 / NRRL B-23946 / LB-34) TaxID=709986 RepID=E8U7Q8_DEIML|nr:hypothetical protein [Deinococcus maricopensis]ADV67097.1 hypothetical protein Deima_1448 [Deinococcus maricopensis DSM 21211]
MSLLTSPTVRLLGYLEGRTRLEIAPNLDPRDHAIVDRWARDLRSDTSPLQRLLGTLRREPREGRPDVRTRAGELRVRALIHEEMARWRMDAAHTAAENNAHTPDTGIWFTEASHLRDLAVSDTVDADVLPTHHAAAGHLDLGVRLQE